MPLLPYRTFLLADQDRMQDLFRAFRMYKARDGMDDFVYVLMIIAGILAVLLILSAIINFWQRRRGYDNPLGLFLSLCRAHKLKWKERWLLWRLARLERLADPARLFLEPQWFLSSHLPEAFRQRALQLKSIRNRLFADLADNPKLDDKGQSSSDQSKQPQGAALPGLKAAPELDVAPWSTTAFPTPLPPHTNTSGGASV
jgi:hypothetical protein